jgi:hypothetical protein
MLFVCFGGGLEGAAGRQILLHHGVFLWCNPVVDRHFGVHGCELSLRCTNKNSCILFSSFNFGFV